MNRVAVIDVVALASNVWSRNLTFLERWSRNGVRIPIVDSPPGLTCTTQSTYLTGVQPSEHGIVGNGWYFRDTCEVRFWLQSSKLLQAPRIWQNMKSTYPDLKIANLFWWYNMYSGADFSLTPRPIYRADGRKIPALYGRPYQFLNAVETELGAFPLHNFWGPGASISSSRWIAESAKILEALHQPDLSFIYLPHLDYNLQRHGPSSPLVQKDLVELDELLSDLITFLEDRGVKVILLSEYAIHDVTRPVFINKVLRDRGYLAVRDEKGKEALDPGASLAFAVCDHQLAHIYVNEAEMLPEIERLIGSIEGVGKVYSGRKKADIKLNHERSGDIVAVAQNDAWFCYQYWLEEDRAPDFARTVDIHRKPGYDPLELFLDPAIRFPKAHLLKWQLARKMGMSSLLNIVPLEPGLVKGSHGSHLNCENVRPLLLSSDSTIWPLKDITACEIHDLIKLTVYGEERVERRAAV